VLDPNSIPPDIGNNLLELLDFLQLNIQPLPEKDAVKEVDLDMIRCSICRGMGARQTGVDTFARKSIAFAKQFLRHPDSVPIFRIFFYAGCCLAENGEFEDLKEIFETLGPFAKVFSIAQQVIDVLANLAQDHQNKLQFNETQAQMLANFNPDDLMSTHSGSKKRQLHEEAEGNEQNEREDCQYFPVLGQEQLSFWGHGKFL